MTKKYVGNIGGEDGVKLGTKIFHEWRGEACQPADGCNKEWWVICYGLMEWASKELGL